MVGPALRFAFQPLEADFAGAYLEVEIVFFLSVWKRTRRSTNCLQLAGHLTALVFFLANDIS